MGLPLAILGASLISGGAMLGSAAMNKNKSGNNEDLQWVDPLDPGQRAIMNKLAPYLQSRIGEGLPSYTGQTVAPMSSYEQTGLSQLGDYLSSGLSPNTKYGLGQYYAGLKGLTPGEVASDYMKYQSPIEQQYMEENILPKIREAYVGSGNYLGSPRMGAEASAWKQFGNEQLSRIGQATQAERDAARGLLPQLGQMTALESELPLRKAEAAMAYGALPRQLQQQELSNKMNEFIRTTPELSPILNQAMQLLGIQSTASYFPQQQTSPFMQLLPGLIQAGGSLGSAAMLSNSYSGLGQSGVLSSQMPGRLPTGGTNAYGLNLWQ